MGQGEPLLGGARWVEKMSTQAGARHCAESEKYLAWEREMSTETAMPGPPVSKAVREMRSSDAATAKCYEVAAAHDGQPAEEWRRLFLSLWR